MDGSHRGLSDWYQPFEAEIINALAEGPQSEWTTGWYASKHEIASACITSSGGVLWIEASASDDFDTVGRDKFKIDHTHVLETIRDAIDTAWENAEQDRKDNAPFQGWSIHWDGSWQETFIKPAGDGCHMPEPPGDNYHQWGLQGESEELDAPLRNAIEMLIERGISIKEWDH